MKINDCRICGNSEFSEILNLGNQFFTGIFPKTKEIEIPKGELKLILCKNCHLLQLSENFDLDIMYGENYGYRSGLNKSMVTHLENKIKYLESQIIINNDDLVIDIGSNDATTLKAYNANCLKVGIDPTASKFKEFYPENINLIPDFFSKEVFVKKFGEKKAKIITSIAMFYDLPNPVQFAKDISFCLDDNGIWHFEQSYMPKMLQTNAYDTICHEHLEFYTLKNIQYILELSEMKILDVTINDINGGSFAVTASKKTAKFKSNDTIINWMIENEKQYEIVSGFESFIKNIEESKLQLLDLLVKLKGEGKKVFGYGASTKGNVLLQYCGITTDLLECIVEVNPEKFGSYTPGTNIPILSELKAKELKPDYFLVLPWHFRQNILKREEKFINEGGKFIFPLPFVEVV